MPLNLFKTHTLKNRPVGTDECVGKTNKALKNPRFNFSYDDDIADNVRKYFFNIIYPCLVTDIPGDVCFVYGYSLSDSGQRIYPIFKIPAPLSKNRALTTKKIECVGAFIIDRGEIIDIDYTYRGRVFTDIIKDMRTAPFTRKSYVHLVVPESISEKTVSGEINFDTLKHWIQTYKFMDMIKTHQV